MWRPSCHAQQMQLLQVWTHLATHVSIRSVIVRHSLATPPCEPRLSQARQVPSPLPWPGREPAPRQSRTRSQVCAAFALASHAVLVGCCWVRPEGLPAGAAASWLGLEGPTSVNCSIPGTDMAGRRTSPPVAAGAESRRQEELPASWSVLDSTSAIPIMQHHPLSPHGSAERRPQGALASCRPCGVACRPCGHACGCS